MDHVLFFLFSGSLFRIRIISSLETQDNSMLKSFWARVFIVGEMFNSISLINKGLHKLIHPFHLNFQIYLYQICYSILYFTILFVKSEDISSFTFLILVMFLSSLSFTHTRARARARTHTCLAKSGLLMYFLKEPIMAFSIFSIVSLFSINWFLTLSLLFPSFYFGWFSYCSFSTWSLFSLSPLQA